MVALAYHYDTRVAGLLMMKELNFLGPAVLHPRRPFAIILGGAKISSKLPLIYSMVHKCDKILIGGGMAFTFLKAAGFNVGRSLVEETLVKSARDLIQLTEELQVELIFPRDVIIAESPTSPSGEVVPISKVEENKMGLDIGPSTLATFIAELQSCETILWNGTVPGLLFYKHHG